VQQSCVSQWFSWKTQLSAAMCQNRERQQCAQTGRDPATGLLPKDGVACLSVSVHHSANALYHLEGTNGQWKNKTALNQHWHENALAAGAVTNLYSQYPQLNDSIVIFLFAAFRRQLQSPDQIHLPALLQLAVLTATARHTMTNVSTVVRCRETHTVWHSEVNFYYNADPIQWHITITTNN